MARRFTEDEKMEYGRRLSYIAEQGHTVDESCDILIREERLIGNQGIKYSQLKTFLYLFRNASEFTIHEERKVVKRYPDIIDYDCVNPLEKYKSLSSILNDFRGNGYSNGMIARELSMTVTELNGIIRERKNEIKTFLTDVAVDMYREGNSLETIFEHLYDLGHDNDYIVGKTTINKYIKERLNIK
jgi:hypothetical protein